MEHTVEHLEVQVDNLAERVTSLSNQVSILEDRVTRDGERFERSINAIRERNDEHAQLIGSLVGRIDKFGLQTERLSDDLKASIAERKKLHESFDTIQTDVAFIKKDMGRMVDGRKLTFQYVMSIASSVVTAALLIWLGLK